LQTTTPAISTAYTLTTNSPTQTYSTTSTALDQAVSSGAFTQYLNQYAVTYNAPGLINVNSSVPNVVNQSPTFSPTSAPKSDSSSSGLSETAIIGIAAGGGGGLLVLIIVVYCFCCRGGAANRSGTRNSDRKVPVMMTKSRSSSNNNNNRNSNSSRDSRSSSTSRSTFDRKVKETRPPKGTASHSRHSNLDDAGSDSDGDEHEGMIAQPFKAKMTEAVIASSNSRLNEGTTRQSEAGRPSLVIRPSEVMVRPTNVVVGSCSGGGRQSESVSVNPVATSNSIVDGEWRSLFYDDMIVNSLLDTDKLSCQLF
jgi:hypothetical protein